MARKIDIELTSRREDGSWTWRAPGARQPRGELDGALLPGGAKVGDVLRADAEFEIDGIVVVSVATPKTDARRGQGDRLEIIGSGSSPVPGVSVILAPGGRRRSDEDGGRRQRRTTPGDVTRPRRVGRAGDAERGGPRTADAERGGPRTSGGRTAPARRSGGRTESPESADRGAAEHGRGGRRRPATQGRSDRVEQGDRRPRRLQPSADYRNAALSELRPEQLPVAEQLLRGGIPAVRQAIEEQNHRATAEGRATVSPEPLLSLAEELLPRMNLATWKDRATAITNAGKDAPLREVRSVVAGASAVALDEEGRGLLAALRSSLDSRVTALRESWLTRVTASLDEERVADALRLSARPPEPAARIPAELAVRLSSAAGAAMAPERPDEEWLALLDAVVASPVRRTVKPLGLPAGAGDELLQRARRSAGQVPELARLLGLPIPPPPGPRRATAGARRT